MIKLKDVSRALLIAVLAVLAALGVNAASPSRMALVGTWPSTYGADTAMVPPSYQQGDPPVLRLDEATALYQSKGPQFIDAREPEDFNAGHIPGAINFPFDEYDDYATKILPTLDKQTQIVTYCGGADCELSLFLARQLMNAGYKNLSIFFGGYTSWQEAGLPLEESKS